MLLVYQAISEMRRLSRAGKTFSFSFVSYSLSREIGEGVTHVENAKLRGRSKANKHPHADILEFYTDPVTGEAKQFYQPLLIEFNGQKVDLK